MTERAKDAATVGEAFDVMLDASDSVRRSATFLRKVVRILIPVVIGLAATVVVQVYQGEVRDDKLARLEGTVASLRKSSEETRVAANKAQIAAESAQKALEAAIAQSQQQTNDSNSAINQINRLYDACKQRKECN
jgi:hypothetical protein